MEKSEALGRLGLTFGGLQGLAGASVALAGLIN